MDLIIWLTLLECVDPRSKSILFFYAGYDMSKKLIYL